MTKFFNLVFIVSIILGINISLVWGNDCEIFAKAAPLVDEISRAPSEPSFEDIYKKELDCCYIDNFKCDEQNNIIGVNFRFRWISDLNLFFEVLGELKNLIEIDMTDMYYNFKNLKPINVGNITNLQKLVFTSSKYPNLFYNTFLKHMPEGFEKLTKLETIDLSHNSIEGNLTEYISSFVKMGSLKELNLSYNDLKGHIPSEIKNMKNLVSLDLSYNKLDGYLSYDLKDMSNLKNFYVNGNEEIEGYVPLFPNLDRCNYKNTGLCTLKGEKCPAPIQCYKLEIEDGNKHNGSPDPNAHIDRAITDKSERNVNIRDGAGHKFNILSPVIIGAIIIFIMF